MGKPRIGITMRLELESRRFYLGRDYCEAIWALGGTPMHISLIPDAGYIAKCLENLDGVLLPGSDSDIDPFRFGEEPHPSLKKVVFEKEQTDLFVLEEAEKKRLPVFGICFGMQAINVFRGGSLIQDIKSQVENPVKHEQGIPLDYASHSLQIAPDSRLSRLITEENVRVNSHHHQAVKRVGENLKATSWAHDGIVESIEDTRGDRFVVGVQWHPELSWQNDDLSRSLFETFIRECQ